MPKLAKNYNQYDDNDNDYYYTSHSDVYSHPRPYSHRGNGTHIHTFAYSASRKHDYTPDIHSNPVRKHRTNRKTRKRSFVQVFVCFFIIFFTLFFAMPFSFNNITKAMFVPTPYKNITTDLNNLAFPTDNYISNAWFMGKRSFRLAAGAKSAKMETLKENVNMPLLENKLTELAALYPSIEPSVYVWDYETGNYININADKIYSTASIIKIPVLIDVYKSIEAGQFLPEDKMALTEYYRTEGSGSLQFKAANSEYTVDELARLMITESDNSATNMLMAKVGSMTDVNQNIRDWGLKNTEVQTWLPDYAGNNHTTAKELAQMLYNIDENDKFLTPVSRAAILNYMGHVHNNRLIQAGLGADAVFLHKTGDIGKMLGDAGIVIAPDGKKYIVVILANRPHNAAAGKDFIVNASNIIYNYMVR